jgi:hypothetical protein
LVKKILLYVPIVLSVVVLGAHLLRLSNSLPVAGAIVLVLLGLLFVRQPWAARFVQTVLVLGTVEWLRTMLALAQVRAALGEPYLRLVLILGVVAAVTLCAALLFQTRALRDHYGN